MGASDATNHRGPLTLCIAADAGWLAGLDWTDGQHKLGMLKFREIRSKKSIMNIYNGGASKAFDSMQAAAA